MSQKKTFQRLRYDRIILFIVIPVVMVITLIAYNINKSGKTDAPKVEFVEFVPVVYLSPSNQTENKYAAGDTNEAEIMRKIAYSTKKYLENNDVTVYISDSTDTLQEKVDFANKNNFTAHVAIHSNTGNGIKNLEGTHCYYNSEVSGSLELSNYVYNSVARLTPTYDNGTSDAAQGATYIYEIAESKVPSCMIEVEYHDSIGNARWIAENTDALGKSVADGIMQYIEFARRQYYYSESSED